MTSFAETHGGRLPRQLDAHDLRHDDVERLAGHRHRHVEAAGADGQHARAAARRRVAVGAEERLAGGAEALQVHLVADAVARPREVDAVLGRDALQEAMVVGVLEARLEHVVVDVADRELRAHARDAHRLELEVGHRAGGVLRQRLVDAERDLAAGDGLAVDEVLFDDLAGQALSHRLAPDGDEDAPEPIIRRGLP